MHQQCCLAGNTTVSVFLKKTYFKHTISYVQNRLTLSSNEVINNVMSVSPAPDTLHLLIEAQPFK